MANFQQSYQTTACRKLTFCLPRVPLPTLIHLPDDVCTAHYGIRKKTWSQSNWRDGVKLHQQKNNRRLSHWETSAQSFSVQDTFKSLLIELTAENHSQSADTVNVSSAPLRGWLAASCPPSKPCVMADWEGLQLNCTKFAAEAANSERNSTGPFHPAPPASTLFPGADFRLNRGPEHHTDRPLIHAKLKPCVHLKDRLWTFLPECQEHPTHRPSAGFSAATAANKIYELQRRKILLVKASGQHY